MQSTILALVPIATAILAIALMVGVTLWNKPPAVGSSKDGDPQAEAKGEKPSRDRFPGRRQGGGGHATEDDNDAADRP